MKRKGFQSPNYTQTPNDLFDELLPLMGYAELKVVLVVIRATFGYHRETAELSIRQIARLAGITPRNAHAGAQAAEARGIIKATVSPGDTTKFSAVVAGDTPALSQGIRAVSPRKGKSGLNKRKKLTNTIKENMDVGARLRSFYERER